MDEFSKLASLTLNHTPENIKAAKKHSKKIDSIISAEEQIKKAMEGKTTKLLLLGSGDSGKTTFLRQMRLLYGVSFTESELHVFKEVIFRNICTNVDILIKAALEGNNDALNNIEAHTTIYNSFSKSREIAANTCTSIEEILSHPAIKHQLEENFTKLAMQDSINFYFTDLKRIIQPNFTPTEQDCLYSRSPTLEITENKFLITGKQTGNGVFAVFDVGGQRSLRNAWAPYFDTSIEAIIFVTSLAGYDQVLKEDETINRMADAIELFKYLINNKLLKKINFIILFNKLDLFQEKLKKSAIVDYFPDYKIPLETQDVETANEFFLHQFLTDDEMNSEKRSFYHHFTTNTDKKMTLFVIKAVIDSVIKSSLDNTGLA